MPPVEGVMVTEAVAAQPRTPLPAVILDKQPPRRLRRRPASPKASACCHPQRLRHHGRRPGAHRQRHRQQHRQRLESRDARSTPAARRASCASRSRCRFRTTTTSPIPTTAAFGPTGVHARDPRLCAGRARWLGAHESAGQRRVPDLGARQQRPARQPGASHWLQVRPGEVLECNGCHVRNAATRTATPMVAWPQGPVQCRVCRRDRDRRTVPRHGDHDLARRRRHHGAGALAHRLVVHRARHAGRALRTAVDHAERERGVRRDLEAGRAADRLVRATTISS